MARYNEVLGQLQVDGDLMKYVYTASTVEGLNGIN